MASGPAYRDGMAISQLLARDFVSPAALNYLGNLMVPLACTYHDTYELPSFVVLP
jgi:hypothetical protein